MQLYCLYNYRQQNNILILVQLVSAAFAYKICRPWAPCASRSAPQARFPRRWANMGVFGVGVGVGGGVWALRVLDECCSRRFSRVCGKKAKKS